MDPSRAEEPDLDPERLTAEEARRYSRHLLLPEVGVEGQERLKASRIAIVGLGGLGSPLGLYLAAAGVGTLGLIDFDTVDATNLQRQVLYGTADVGHAKLAAAAARLRDVNPHVRLEGHPSRLDDANALAVLGAYDIVCDASDNFPTRYWINDACVKLGLPSVYGSILRFEGQVSVFWGARGPCYRCLFPSAPPPGAVPSCGEAGVLGVLPGVVGALQANEAIKLALGLGEPLLGRLLLFDALGGKFRELALHKNPACPVCAGAVEAIALEPESAADAACRAAPAVPAPAAESATAEPDPAAFDVEVQDLDRWRRQGRPLLLLDVRTPEEHRIARLEPSLLMPLHELPRRLAELDPARDIVVYCHYGPRSSYATQFLRQQGLRRVWNLAGGIDAWSAEIDAAVLRY